MSIEFAAPAIWINQYPPRNAKHRGLYDDFSTAVKHKIIVEVASVPEPGTLLLLGCALGGLYGIRRKVS